MSEKFTSMAYLATATAITAAACGPAPIPATPDKPKTHQVQVPEKQANTCGIDMENPYAAGFTVGEKKGSLEVQRYALAHKLHAICEARPDVIAKCKDAQPSLGVPHPGRVEDPKESCRQSHCVNELEQQWLDTKTGQECRDIQRDTYRAEDYQEKWNAEHPDHPFLAAQTASCVQARAEFYNDKLTRMESPQFSDNKTLTTLENINVCVNGISNQQGFLGTSEPANKFISGFRWGQDIGKIKGRIGVVEDHLRETGQPVDALKAQCEEDPRVKGIRVGQWGGGKAIDFTTNRTVDPGMFDAGLRQEADYLRAKEACLAKNVKVADVMDPKAYEKRSAELVSAMQSTFKVEVTVNNVPKNLVATAEALHDHKDQVLALEKLWNTLGVYPISNEKGAKTIIEKAGIQKIQAVKNGGKLSPSGIAKEGNKLTIDVDHQGWENNLHFHIFLGLDEQSTLASYDATTRTSTRNTRNPWERLNSQSGGKAYSSGITVTDYTGYDATIPGFTSTIAPKAAKYDQASLWAAMFGGQLPAVMDRIKAGDKKLELALEALTGSEIDPAKGEFVGAMDTIKKQRLGFGTEFAERWSKPAKDKPSLMDSDFFGQLAKGTNSSVPLSSVQGDKK